jgi:DNA-binding transcriptional LysR family regulator
MHTNLSLAGRSTAITNLVAVIDAAAGDYPLLFLEEGPEPRLLWSYSRLEITIAINRTQEEVQFDELNSTVTVCSIAAGFALVAATEAVRQGRQEPYLQYRANLTKPETPQPSHETHKSEVAEKSDVRKSNPV